MRSELQVGITLPNQSLFFIRSKRDYFNKGRYVIVLDIKCFHFCTADFDFDNPIRIKPGGQINDVAILLIILFIKEFDLRPMQDKGNIRVVLAEAHGLRERFSAL